MAVRMLVFHPFLRWTDEKISLFHLATTSFLNIILFTRSSINRAMIMPRRWCHARNVVTSLSVGYLLVLGGPNESASSAILRAKGRVFFPRREDRERRGYIGEGALEESGSRHG